MFKFQTDITYTELENCSMLHKNCKQQNVCQFVVYKEEEKTMSLSSSLLDESL